MIDLPDLTARLIAGAIVAASIALAARATNSLSASGVLAAVVAGTLAVAAGWSWGVLLVALFISASILSKIGGARKAELVNPVVEKDGERDAFQVLANGGVYVAAAVGSLISHSPAWYALALGALAAAAADTWATEVGTLAGGEPVSISTGRRVPAGTSGGITLIGSLAGVTGALFIGALGVFANWPVSFAAAALGGMVGALTDSILGATLQTRRWCDRCARPTERAVHDCGAPTRQAGGLARLDNDGVNAICTAVGAAVSLLLSMRL